MKIEPIIAYNHLQEEQDESTGSVMSGQHSLENSKWNWRALITPVAIAIELAAIVAMAFFMIQEIFR